MPAVAIEASYTKTLGLPNYSSHSYTLTIKKTIKDEAQLDAESERLHEQLQRSVDERMKTVGFLPDQETYGAARRRGPKIWKSSGWVATDAQRLLLDNLIARHQLQQDDIRALAGELFGDAAKWPLQGEQAGQLIEELVKRHSRGEEGQAPGDARIETESEFSQE